MSKAAVDLKFRAEGRCRLCLRPSRIRRLTRHRIVPGRYKGSYTPQNCVPLCRPCHELVDGWNRAESLVEHQERRLARKMLRASLWPIEVAYARAHWPVGTTTFDEVYPKPTRELVMERRTEIVRSA